MGQAIGNVLPLAVAVAVFPVPIIAAVLVIASDGGRAKGVAFVLAWCVGLAAIGAIALLLAGAADANDDGRRAPWVNALLLGLGLLLLALAAKQWRGRPAADEEAPLPGWMRTIGDFTVARSAGAGLFLTALNPKNVLLTVAAAAEIAEVELPASQEIVVLAIFVLLASAGVLAPLVLTLVLGDRSRAQLERLQGWMARHNAAIMAALLLLIGTKLIGDAISGFTA